MKRSRPILATALALCSVSCSAVHARQRTARLERQLDEVRYQQPIDDVWQGLRKLLADKGYPLANADAVLVGQEEMNLAQRILSPAKATYALETDVGLFQRLGVVGANPKAVKGYGLETGWHAGAPRHRIRAEGAQGPGGVSVRLTSIAEDVVDHRDPETRDAQLELELARRLDPAAAQRAEAAADAKK